MNMSDQFDYECLKTNLNAMRVLRASANSVEDFVVLDITQTILDRLSTPADKLAEKVKNFLQANDITSWDGSVLGHVPVRDSSEYQRWTKAIGLDIRPLL